MTIQQIVGDNIRHIRERKNMSQEVLAWDAQMSRTYIGEIERAKKTISIGRLVKIAKVLEVAPEMLLIEDYYKI